MKVKLSEIAFDVKSLLPIDTGLDFLQAYSADYSTIDDYLRLRYKFRYLDIEKDTSTGGSLPWYIKAAQQYELFVKSIVIARQFTYRTWYESIIQTFNPIENYDRMEEWTDTDKGITAKTTGTDQNTNLQNGSITTTTSNVRSGEVLTSGSNIRNGNTHISESKGSQTDTVTNQIRPWDTSSANQDRDKTTSVAGARTDTSDTIYDGLTDTQSGKTDYNNLTDVQSGNTSYNNLQNVTTFSHNNEVNKDTTATHSGRVHGNIGVTTAPKMIEEFRQYALFDFYAKMYEDILSEICVVDLEYSEVE